MTALLSGVFEEFSAEVRVKLSSVKPAKNKNGELCFVCSQCVGNPIFLDLQSLVWHTLMEHFQKCSFYCDSCLETFGIAEFGKHVGNHFKFSEEREMKETFEDEAATVPCDIEELKSVVDCQVTIEIEDSESSENGDVVEKSEDTGIKPSQKYAKTRKKCLLNDAVKSCASKVKRFKCDVCKKEFRKKEWLKTHYRSHTGEKPYICAECGKQFSLRPNLKRHELIHRGEKPYLCIICGKSFNQPSTLKSHHAVHIGREPKVTAIVNQPIEVDKDRSFQCSLCPKSFSYKSCFEIHLRTHTGEKPFQCQHCGKEFAQQVLLNLHEANIHALDKGYRCDICKKQFGVKGGLKNHMSVHTGERPFQCLDCGKAFGNRGNLSKHKLIHTGEKPFLCTLCGRAFRQKSTLKTHMRSHSNANLKGH